MSFMWPSFHRGEECRSSSAISSASSKEVVVDGLDDDDPFFLVKRLVVFFPHGCCTLLTSISPGFSTDSKAHKYYLEYGL
jgi:hypothetical protein